MSNYPNLVFSRVSNGASILATTFAKIQTAIVQVEQDLVSAKGAVSTLATFLNRTITSQGTFIYGSHGELRGVGTSLHHSQIHANRHRTSDLFWASAAMGGLVNTDIHKKIEYGATQSTRNDWLLSSTWTGSGGGGRTITCNFRPAIVYAEDRDPDIRHWEAVTGMTFVFRHEQITGESSPHRRVRSTDSIQMVASGFNIGSTLNLDGDLYHFTAIKGD